VVLQVAVLKRDNKRGKIEEGKTLIQELKIMYETIKQ